MESSRRKRLERESKSLEFDEQLRLVCSMLDNLEKLNRNQNYFEEEFSYSLHERVSNLTEAPLWLKEHPVLKKLPASAPRYLADLGESIQRFFTLFPDLKPLPEWMELELERRLEKLEAGVGMNPDQFYENLERFSGEQRPWSKDVVIAYVSSEMQRNSKTDDKFGQWFPLPSNLVISRLYLPADEILRFKLNYEYDFRTYHWTEHDSIDEAKQEAFDLLGLPFADWESM